MLTQLLSRQVSSKPFCIPISSGFITASQYPLKIVHLYNGVCYPLLISVSQGPQGKEIHATSINETTGHPSTQLGASPLLNPISHLQRIGWNFAFCCTMEFDSKIWCESVRSPISNVLLGKLISPQCIKPVPPFLQLLRPFSFRKKRRRSGRLGVSYAF